VQQLRLWNDRVEVLLSREGLLSSRLTLGEQGEAHVPLCEGQVQVRGAGLIEGLFYHNMPCCFESVVVRQEGVPEPLLQRVTGTWPAAVDDDQLEMYPQLHCLEERKTGLPWRYERWYSLAGTFLIFESEQYFERSRPQPRGKNWVRFIVQVRQVTDLAGVVGGAGPAISPLLGTHRSAEGHNSL
jgi:hypothetical protein